MYDETHDGLVEFELRDDVNEETLKMRTFRVPIITNPTMFEVRAWGAKSERKTVTIKGYTLKDAKRRARIE